MWFPNPSVIFLSLCFLSLLHSPVFAAKKVYLGSHSHGPEVTEADYDRVTESHYQFLGSYLGSYEKAKEAIFYSYQRHINGFSANLEEHEAAEIAKHPEVVSVFLNRGKSLHTTHSWEFMMVEKNGVTERGSIWDKARYGEDTIIANLDTGVWPESESFSDKGYGAVPSRWKGKCENNTASAVPCNRKLIGSRYYNRGYVAFTGKLNYSDNTPLDLDGHGTHTLSTAGGNFVRGANVMGVWNGTAKGGSPKARVASYKVCWKPINQSECFDSDIMQAIDEAISDGVDILSVSLGAPAMDYFDDGISIGVFHAVKNGILVVCSAGNDGPRAGSVTNVAPWMFTVGASTLDREFVTIVKLKDGSSFKGTSLVKGLPDHKLYQLITGAQAKAANASSEKALLCEEGTLDPKKVKGKILVCLRGITARIDKGIQALVNGAVGMILCNDISTGNEIMSDAHILPASQLTYKDGLKVFAYIKSTKNPMGNIMSPQQKFGVKPAPFMASFSSKGPNTITPEILKPDITAPGVNIIAAFTEGTSPSGLDSDTRRTPYLTDSGTSMSCPHVAGVAGLLKTMYPDWSSAAIRSAIMTTARTRDNRRHPMLDGSYIKGTPFNYGSGHMRPNRAMNPGLIYDLKINDYLDFLCTIGYNQTKIQPFANGPYNCPQNGNLMDFNYPSISVPNLKGKVTVTRVVTNVGKPGIYLAEVRQPLGVSVTVEPNMLKFAKVGEEKKFKLSFEAKWDNAASDYVFGELIWTDQVHYVRSPIVVLAS